MRTERSPLGLFEESGSKPTNAFRHEALLYNGLADFVDTASNFIRDGLRQDDDVLVVVSEAKIQLLREELGSDADAVAFADMADVGANPARIIPAWCDFVAERGAGGRHIRGIGEQISNERSPQALIECQRHESLLNLAFADAPAWWLLCPYDTAVLPDAVLDEAMRSHPFFLEGGRHRDSENYRDLDMFKAPFATSLPEPKLRPFELTFTLADLGAVRHQICFHADAHGLDPTRRDDFMIAVNEIAINSLRHGGGEGILRLWREGDMLTCEIWDRGQVNNPLVGRCRPTPGQEGGFGMWLVNQLCDLVQMRTFEDGSVVRVHMSLRAA